MERFVEDSELDLDLQGLLNLDWSTVDPLPEKVEDLVPLTDESADYNELDQDFVDREEPEEILEALEEQSLKYL